MRSKLTITHTAECECYESLIEIFARHGEYECPKCGYEAISIEVQECNLKDKYAVGPEPGYFTYGPYDTEDEALSIQAGGENKLLCSIGYNGYTVLYRCDDNQWLRV